MRAKTGGRRGSSELSGIGEVQRGTAQLVLAVVLLVFAGNVGYSADSPLGSDAGKETAHVTVVEADWWLRGGMIHDGTTAKPFQGDVAVRGDRIVAVGQFRVAGKPKIVDATDKIIAPGFIDLHNHSDSSILDSKSRGNLNFLHQGCTTIVTGNCGSGVVDVAKYFAQLEKEGAGTHVIHLMPHGSVRQAAFGSANRPATEKELQKMCDLVDKGMRDGAFGMTTGLIYVPGTYAKTEEIVAVARVVAKHGGIYASHIRNEGTNVLEAVSEAIRIGEQAQCPVHISHLKASGQKAWGLGNDICALIAKHRETGAKISADQYPYNASSTSLSAMVLPTWALEGGNKRFQERLADPATRPRMEKYVESALSDRGGGERLLLARYPKRKEWVGKNIADISKLVQRTPLQVCMEIFSNGGAQAIHFGMSDEDVRLIAGKPFVATASDGAAQVVNDDKPHPRSYGTFPRKIGEFAHRRGWLSVEQAIYSSTGLPAEILGLKDRGYIKTGLVADLVVFDLKKLKDPATFVNPHQYGQGFSLVMVAGKAAVEQDRATGILAGRPIRKPGRPETSSSRGSGL